MPKLTQKKVDLKLSLTVWDLPPKRYSWRAVLALIVVILKIAIGVLTLIRLRQ